MDEMFRLSRIRAPRGTLATTILLAVVFIAFGLFVSATAAGEAVARPAYLEPSALNFANWLLGLHP